MTIHQLVIRPLTPEDAPGIARLMHEHPLWHERDPDQQSAAICRYLDRGEFGLVAEHPATGESVLAGFVIMSDTTFGNHGYIRLIGTRREDVGHGTGSHLLREAERLLASRGVQGIFLLCTDWNTDAQRFYERHGYVRVGALPDWHADDVQELIYLKRDLAVRDAESTQTKPESRYE